MLYQITRLHSRTTFNDRFSVYFIDNDFTGRRSFTLLETYKILEYWQGDGKWAECKLQKRNARRSPS